MNKPITDKSEPRHDGFGYVGGGIYACLCGHRLNGGGSGRPLEYTDDNQDTIVELKMSHMAHRLDVEPEKLLEEPKFKVIVHVDGRPDYTTTVHAPDQWKARTRAMLEYPYPLRGELVNYTVRNVA